MTFWEISLVLGMALVTFTVRYPVLALMSSLTLPPSLLRALKFIPPAVLSAIIFPAVAAPTGAYQFTLYNAHLIAAACAAIVAWRSGNLLLTITSGMAILWLWRFAVAPLLPI